MSPHRHTVRVRYGEVDMQRVVFNAHYLAYCDDAVEMWFRRAGVDVPRLGWDIMLKRAEIEWQGSATVADQLAIDVAVSRWGRTSFDVSFLGTVADHPVFTATITYVGVKLGTAEPVPAPEEVRRRLGGADASPPP